jgi:type IV secretory pathway TrbF-like protein
MFHMSAAPDNASTCSLQLDMQTTEALRTWQARCTGVRPWVAETTGLGVVHEVAKPEEGEDARLRTHTQLISSV